MAIIIKRTDRLVTGLVQGNYSWRFPANYDYFSVSYNDLTHVLETEGFEPVFENTNGHEILEVKGAGGIIKER